MNNQAPATAPSKPVLNFLIPLRPKRDPEGWEVTCRLLEQTLNSLREQTDGRWSASIAGHQRPQFLDDEQDSRIRFHEVDFEVDKHKARPGIDKSWKIAFASMRASSQSPIFHMVLDADDLVHRELVAGMAPLENCPAVVFDRGWEFDLHYGKAFPRDHLAAICGSTIAYSTTCFPMAAGRGWEEWNKVPAVTCGHNEAKADLAMRGYSPHIPKQRLVAYITGHLSSLEQRHLARPWRRRIGFAVFGRKITATMRDDFQLRWK